MSDIVKLRVLTEEEKANIATLMAAGSTINQVAGKIGRSFKLVKKYVETQPAQVEIASIKERLVTKYQAIAENCLDRLMRDEIIEAATARDLATISGICVDKSRLLQGESTENVGVVIGSLDEQITDWLRLSR